MLPPFDQMNETDVREHIVRPVLEGLGYKLGTENNIRTEVTLSYAKAFLGRKKETDPDLRGRADYICEVISYCRWVVEVKSPSGPIDRESIEQAHTYAAHPEIGAMFFLLSNGKRFSLFRIGELENPVIDFQFTDVESTIQMLTPLLKPATLKKKIAQLIFIDRGKPLAPGYPSEMKVLRGTIQYDEHYASHPQINAELAKLRGMRAQLMSGKVFRAEDGLLQADVIQTGPMGQFQPMYEMLGLDRLIFRSADEYISTDPSKPTILQNMSKGGMMPGSTIPASMANKGMIVPFGMEHEAFTQAVGYLDENKFKGTFNVEYKLGPMGRVPAQYALMMNLLQNLKMRSSGTFEADLDSQ